MKQNGSAENAEKKRKERAERAEKKRTHTSGIVAGRVQGAGLAGLALVPTHMFVLLAFDLPKSRERSVGTTGVRAGRKGVPVSTHTHTMKCQSCPRRVT